MSVRIQIIGGFLGAGKTTLITRIARKLMDDGVRVGIITNDQADSLVDTQYSRSLGIDCSEVSGGCFCCRFPDLLENARELVRNEGPTIILAEPVGSCTDLMATVVAPLKRYYGEEFQVAPLMIMVDADRASRERMSDDSLGGYLRKHQISEAECVIVSKIDLVKGNALDRISSDIAEINPMAFTIRYSSLEGEGFGEIMSLVLSENESCVAPRSLDYERYAEAEAELGWYNGSFTGFIERVDTYLLCREALESISRRFPMEDIAHVKVMVISESNAAKMSSVMGRISLDAVGGSRFASGSTRITVNARVASTPEKLRDVVTRAVISATEKLGVFVEMEHEDFFSPAAPNPTYRMS